MRQKIAKVLSIIILLTIISIGCFSQIDKISACNPSYMKIQQTTYGDFDHDGFEDDLFIEAKMNIHSVGTFKTLFHLFIQLPSGKTYHFLCKRSIVFNNDEVTIEIIIIDIATESGWYTAFLMTHYTYKGTSGIMVNYWTFDPPTETGPGDPSIILTVNY